MALFSASTSLLILLEPTLNPVWAWLIQDESPSRWALIGGSIILVSSAAKTWLDPRRRQAKKRDKLL